MFHVNSILFQFIILDHRLIFSYHTKEMEREYVEVKLPEEYTISAIHFDRLIRMKRFCIKYKSHLTTYEYKDEPSRNATVSIKYTNT